MYDARTFAMACEAGRSIRRQFEPAFVSLQRALNVDTALDHCFVGLKLKAHTGSRDSRGLMKLPRCQFGCCGSPLLTKLELQCELLQSYLFLQRPVASGVAPVRMHVNRGRFRECSYIMTCIYTPGSEVTATRPSRRTRDFADCQDRRYLPERVRQRSCARSPDQSFENLFAVRKKRSTRHA